MNLEVREKVQVDPGPEKRPTLKWIDYKKKEEKVQPKLNKSVEQELNLSGS
jgi:hypothetical protein